MRSISILSVFIVVIPFIGLPSIYQTVLVVLVGSIIFVKSLLIERSQKIGGYSNTDLVFKQNKFPTIKEDLHPLEINKLEESQDVHEQEEEKDESR